MTLSARALVPLQPIPQLEYTCHAATWFWAALEAEASALVTARPVIDRAGNIGTMRGGAQSAMLQIRPIQHWLYANGQPPLGSVILWPQKPTHTAVVTAQGIAGYNQACVFPHLGNNRGHTICQFTQIAQDMREWFVISEFTIVQAAAAFGL